MDCLCYRKKENNKENYVQDYKNLSDRNLKKEFKNLNSDRKRNCCFGSLYTTTCIGTVIASCMSTGLTFVISGPTVAVSGLSAAESFYKMNENSQKIKVIKETLKKREQNEITFIDNQNSVSIFRQDI